MKASKNLEVWRALNIRQDQWINVHGSFIAVKLKNTFALRSCPYCRIVIIIVLRVLRLGLHPWQGWVGGVEMREHLSIS